MSVFTQRPGGFKAGVVLLFFSSLLFFVGFVSPFWSSFKQMVSQGSFAYSATYYEGLWMACVVADTFTECGSYGVDGFADWFHAVRALACLGMVGLVVACIYTLATNCCRAVAGPRSRFLEIFAACAGLLGFVGCMVYVGLRNKDMTTDGTLNSVYKVIFFYNLDRTFTWAFYLAAVGSALSVIAGILVAIFNKPVEVEANPAGGVVMSTVPVGNSPYGPPQPYGVQPAGYVYNKA